MSTMVELRAQRRKTDDGTELVSGVVEGSVEVNGLILTETVSADAPSQLHTARFMSTTSLAHGLQPTVATGLPASFVPAAA